jgi:hypothetical protein
VDGLSSFAAVLFLLLYLDVALYERNIQIQARTYAVGVLIRRQMCAFFRAQRGKTHTQDDQYAMLPES